MSSRLQVMGVMLFLCFAFTSWGAAGVELPSSEKLRSLVEENLPVGWIVRDLRIVAEANKGDEVRPHILRRFEADVAPIGQLFFLDDESIEIFAPFVPIIPSLGVDDSRTLYGVAESTYSAGAWNTTLDFENRPFSNTGQPIDFFEGAVVIRGSEDEARFLETFGERMETYHRLAVERAVGERDAEVRARIAALDAELAAFEEEREAQLRNAREQARMDSESAIAAAKVAHQAEIRRLREEHEQAMARRKVEHEQTLQALTVELGSAEELSKLTDQVSTTLDGTLALLSATLEAEGNAALEETRNHLMLAIQSARAEHEAALAALKAQREAELASMHAEQKATLEALRAEHEREVAVRQQRHQQNLDALTSEMTEAQELIAMAEDRQATLRQLQETLALEVAADAERLRKVREALTSDDDNVREAAMLQAFTADDDILRGMALKEIYRRPPMNTELRHLALVELISGGGTFAFRPSGGNLQGQHLVSVSITQFDQRSGKFSATLQMASGSGSGRGCGGGNSGSATGSLANAVVALHDTNDYCSLSFTLSNDGQLRGDFQNSYYSLSGQVTGQLAINLSTWVSPDVRQKEFSKYVGRWSGPLECPDGVYQLTLELRPYSGNQLAGNLTSIGPKNGEYAVYIDWSVEADEISVIRQDSNQVVYVLRKADGGELHGYRTDGPCAGNVIMAAIEN